MSEQTKQTSEREPGNSSASVTPEWLWQVIRNDRGLTGRRRQRQWRAAIARLRDEGLFEAVMDETMAELEARAERGARRATQAFRDELLERAPSRVKTPRQDEHQGNVRATRAATER